MTGENRLKKLVFKALTVLTFLLNIIAIPVIVILIFNYFEQINREKIYDQFEEKNIIYSNALMSLIIQKKMEFVYEDVFDSARSVKYSETIDPSIKIDGRMKMSYGCIHFDVEPIPGTVRNMWAEFSEPYREEAQGEHMESMKSMSEVFGNLAKNLQEYNEGFTAFEQKNYVIAMKKFKVLASNNSGVSLKLGLMYKSGLGTEVDYQQAEEWFLHSARLDNTLAIEELAKLYEEHNELNGDFAKIAQMYVDIAQYGDGYAQKNLAKMYEHGKGVDKNLIVARTLYSLFVAKNEADQDDSMQAIARLGEQLTSEQIEESVALTNKILQDGHLKNVLYEYVTKKNIQGDI